MEIIVLIIVLDGFSLLNHTKIEEENSAIDLAYKIYEIVRELDNCDGLEKWYNISEMIDDFRYGDNISNLSKVALIVTIEKEVKKLLNRNRN